MKQLLIILFTLFLLPSDIIGQREWEHILYRWDNFGEVWKEFGDKATHPVYRGHIRDGRPNGQGFLISPDGWKYEGNWFDGYPNGQGTHTFHDGSKIVGEWSIGRLLKGIGYDKKGNVYSKYMNGKELIH